MYFVFALLTLKVVLAQYSTCSKTYGSYLLVTQTNGLIYSTVAAACSAYGAVPASINSLNWSSMLNLVSWCSIGAIATTNLPLPWIGGGQVAGNCPIITSVFGNTDFTTASVPCDQGQTRPVLCQFVNVQTNTASSVTTTTTTFVTSLSTTTTATVTRVVTVTFTDGTTTITSTLIVPISGTTTRQINTATISTSTTLTVSEDETLTVTTTTLSSTGTTTRTIVSLKPITKTTTDSTRTTITSPSLTQVTCITAV